MQPPRPFCRLRSSEAAAAAAAATAAAAAATFAAILCCRQSALTMAMKCRQGRAQAASFVRDV